jgi:hypothetical protein
LFGTLFAARTYVREARWENARGGKAGWLPAGRPAATDGQQTVENIEMPAHNAD